MLSEYGLYILSDKYFEEFSNKHLIDNKNESRPFYLAVKSSFGIIWLVPISSQVANYQGKIDRYEQKHGKGNCFLYYITSLKGEKRAFLIGNAIPVTEAYILRPFTVDSVPFKISDKEDIKQIKSKLSRFLTLVRQGKFHSNVDILKIEKELLGRKTGSNQ